MLNYQSTSFHDAQVLRQVLGLRAAPEFEAWLERMGLGTPAGTDGQQQRLTTQLPGAFTAAIQRLGGPST
jgi:ethanolamine ammonia-lyase large subunit